MLISTASWDKERRLNKGNLEAGVKEKDNPAKIGGLTSSVSFRKKPSKKREHRKDQERSREKKRMGLAGIRMRGRRTLTGGGDQHPGSGEGTENLEQRRGRIGP